MSGLLESALAAFASHHHNYMDKNKKSNYYNITFKSKNGMTTDTVYQWQKKLIKFKGTHFFTLPVHSSSINVGRHSPPNSATHI